MTETVFTVSELNQRIKSLIELHYKSVWIEGEISNLAMPSSGHWYFTLKDNRAQVRCAMFKGRNRLVRITPKAGDKIKVKASASLYEGRGDYQLIVEQMSLAGTGDLHAQFEALKAKLHHEGLFAAELKQELPYLPQKIGVITSATGAAVHDILNVLKRRFPLSAILVIPVQVQGQGAGQDIAKAIDYANQHQLCDLLIVGRGGGSLEDLWAFNEECVARALFTSTIPTISAVGHEVDTTIADYVADARAPTPSVAAEMAVPDQLEMASYIDQLEQRLIQLIRQKLDPLTQKIAYFSKRIQSPDILLQSNRQNLSHIEFRLRSAIKNAIEEKKSTLNNIHSNLTLLNPCDRIEHIAERIKQLNLRLGKCLQRTLEDKKQKVKHQAQLLHNLSPLTTLDRGYAIVQTEDKQNVIRSAEQVQTNEKLSITLARGELVCQALHIKA